MKKDEIFFSQDGNGLTTTSANYSANIAKECYRLLEEGLSQVRFYTTEVGLVSSDTTKILREGTTKETLFQIQDSLVSIAKLKSLIAWLREAIKAKERLTKEAMNLSDETVCATLGITLPERPKMADVPTDDDIVATYNIKQRNRIYYLDTLCAEIGSYIHIDGTLSKERTALQKVLSETHKLEGTGRDAMLYTYHPSVEVDNVDTVFFSLQKQYREYQAELNSMLHEVKTAVQEAQRKANLEYEEACANYNTQMNAIHARIKAYKDEQVSKAQSLKIIIPDSLTSIYEEIQRIVKK